MKHNMRKRFISWCLIVVLAFNGLLSNSLVAKEIAKETTESSLMLCSSKAEHFSSLKSNTTHAGSHIQKKSNCIQGLVFSGFTYEEYNLNSPLRAWKNN